MAINIGFKSIVLNAYAVLAGEKPGYAALQDHLGYVQAQGIGLTGYKAALEAYFSSTSTATLATALLTNLGLTTSFTQAQAEAFLNANTGNRVSAMLSLADQLYSYGGTDAALKTASAAYVAKIAVSNVYSSNEQNVYGESINTAAGQTINLTTGFDSLMGTALNDTFNARTIGNVNTLNDRDTIDGGAGTDIIYADFTNVGNAITPMLTNIETVVVRAQTTTTDPTNGNNLTNGTVQIDAQRSLAVNAANQVTAKVGVTRWESNNSRSDVIIEDVRIGNEQKTKDITIAMVETDPGNVDFGVYFDQFSLRNASTGSTTLTIQLMDTGAAGNAATAATPLLNNPYDQFKLGINGVLSSIQLDKVAVAAADTYAQLLAVFNTALTGTGITAALSGTFTITDPISNTAVTGQSIVLSSSGTTAITSPTGSGWFNTTGASVPPTSNIYTTFSTSATNVTELVTSSIVLDDVGRGSTGGDLVVGGLSVGQTSTSRGVERFEITVNDNSKLQTINSTNNALREVTIINKETSNTVVDAYTTTVTNAGNLTVNGNATNSLGQPQTSGGNQLMDGVDEGSPYGVHQGAGAAGFTDVRLIDGSAMAGKLAFTAAITGDSVTKYVTTVDTAGNPVADVAGSPSANVNFNVPGANFNYLGGANADTMVVTIDGGVTSSRSNAVSGRGDFTFQLDGNAGNDAITLTVLNSALPMAGGAQAWYNNQKLNANIAINGGDGNDTIRTPGAGDVIINSGTGDDTMYTDNTGALAATATASGAATAAAIAYTNAAATELSTEQAAWIRANALGSSNSSGTTGLARTSVANKVIALKVLDDLTPTNNTVLPVIANAAITGATATAVASGAITFDQKIAIDLAYGAISAGGTVTAAATIETASTYAGATAVAGNVTQAGLTAGDAAVAAIMATLRADVAANTAATANETYQAALLNTTQLAVVAANKAINTVYEPADGGVAGSGVKLAGLTALQAALVNGTSAANVVAAINTAINNGSITTGAQANSIVAAAGAGDMDATEAAAVLAILSPLVNTATITNNTNLATLAAAQAADALVVNAQAAAAAADPTAAAGQDVANPAAIQDAVGSTEVATAANTAATASTRAAADVAAAQAINTAWATLKAAVNVGALAADLSNAIANANAAGVAAAAASSANGTGAVTDTISGVTAALAALAASATVAPGLTAADELTFDTGAFGNFNAASLDSQVIINNVLLDSLTVIAADKAAIATATATASTIATAAAASGAADLTIASPKAVYVFDTSNQASTYNRVTMDDRNLADLKSDANNTYNFFNSTVKVIYKGIEASVVVAGTNFTTTDLEINQAIKKAINTDAVLSKLLLATDGPANSLVVTSLIDGQQSLTNLAVSVTMPTTVGSSATAAGAAYGLGAAATDAQVIAFMATTKTAFDTKGDYTTQWAEAGAGGGNTNLVGANSKTSSDNTIVPGTGNDVVVLGTTVGTDLMTSSNERVIYSGSFGNDTIVYFAATGLGIDTLDFSLLNGRASAFGSLSADKSIVVGAPVATALTAAQVAALFTDSATAINHVYVGVDTTNIGSIWQVADAAGTGGIVATLVGSIDLADTAWASLTAANFV